MQVLSKVLQFYKKIRQHPLSMLLIAGLAVRIALAPLTSDAYDVQAWYDKAMSILGTNRLYEGFEIGAYPPIWLYLLGLISKLTYVLGNPEILKAAGPVSCPMVPGGSVLVSPPYFNIAVKSLLIMGDVAVGVLIFAIIKSISDIKRARLGFVLWFFNPFVIFSSSVHGAYDVLAAMMVMIALSSLLEKKYTITGLALSMGTLLKYYPIYLAPFYFFHILMKEYHTRQSTKTLKGPISGFLKLVGGGILGVMWFLLPSLLASEAVLTYSITRNVDVFMGAGGINFWGVLSLNPINGQEITIWLSHYSVLILNLPFILLGLSLILGITISLRGKKRLEDFIYGNIVILSLLLTLGLPTTNPQFIIWLLPFLIIAMCLYGNYRIRFHLIWASALLFYIGLTGILYDFYPAAMFTSLLNHETIENSLNYYLQLSFIGCNFSRLLRFLSAGIGCVSILTCLAPRLNLSKLRSILGRD